MHKVQISTRIAIEGYSDPVSIGIGPTGWINLTAPVEGEPGVVNTVELNADEALAIGKALKRLAKEVGL